MYLFTEKGIRGGISYIAKRFCKANNKYMQSYDDKKSSKYSTYFDANNLYSWAMNQYLPYSKFKWFNQKESDQFDVNSNSENISMGHILEVDLEYPDKLIINCIMIIQ